VRQVIALGLLTVDHDAYSSLKLTEAARRCCGRAQGPAAPVPEAGQAEAQVRPPTTSRWTCRRRAEIFEKLRWWRVETARAHNVPAYVIFHDATMREIAKVKPTSLDDLRGVSGVGEKKLARKLFRFRKFLEPSAASSSCR
jgi:ATP-dependent DNA helicase RecQ